MDMRTDAMPVRAVCFTGHRPAKLTSPGSAEMARLEARLDAEVRKAIAGGCFTFYAGGALGFDMLAEECVLAYKREDPRIRLILALPAPDQALRFSAENRLRYDAILEQADEVHYASDHCSPNAMLARDRYMVDHADLCICYLKAMKGGTYYTVNHALKAGIPVLNLAMENN